MVREARFSIPRELGFEIPELRDNYLDDLDSLPLEPDTHPAKNKRSKEKKQLPETRRLRKRAL